MRVFYEDAPRDREVFLILKKKEVSVIIDALECAIKVRPRKSSWKSVLDNLLERVAIF